MNGGNDPDRGDGEQLRELGYLCGAVSHHVINAFSAIVSNAELIRSSDGGVAETAGFETLGTGVIETAMSAAQVSRRLIDWARRASSVEGGQAALKFPPADLNQLVRDVVETEKSVGPSQVNWAVNLGPIPTISADGRGLAPMLGYLLRNSREALVEASGTIEVSTYVDERNWLVLAIQDTGCGMSLEVLKRATEPFFSTKAGHDGVGLTIAQAIWRRNRGSLSIDSHVGQGTTIRLSIAPTSPPAPTVRPAPLAEYQRPL